MSETQLLRTRDVAKDLGVTPGRVGQLVREGVIPSIRFGRAGRAIRIPRAAWRAWLEERAEEAQIGKDQ